MTAGSDGAYKQFFSHPLMVRELLQGFVREDWVDELDFSTLEKLNAHYVSDDLKQRSDDVVWRVRTRDGPELFIYLLLEFQSRSDPWMALRLMTYVGLLYQDLVKSEQLRPGQGLPPVFPVVLYNGDPPWAAAQDMTSLLSAAPDSLAAYQPRLRYWLLDEGRADKRLRAQRGNAVASLVRMEGGLSPKAMQAEIRRLIVHLKDPSHDSLRRAFTVWINRALRRMIEQEPLPAMENLQEVDAMLADHVESWTEQWKKQGLREGRREGRKEGRREGHREGRREGLKKGRLEGQLEGLEQGRQNQAAMLERQLIRRFGPLPDWAVTQLRSAESQQLETWADNIFDAASLDTLLKA